MHDVNQKPQIMLYKASAGSGKTYTLANYYASLLIKNPYGAKEILAVTFTIKATLEMKMRIIKVMQELAGTPQENQNFKYTDVTKVKKDTNLSYKEIHERSKKALFNILHNYQDFRVTTIDSFLHHLFTGFAREAQLPPAMELELDLEKTVAEIIDAMLFKLSDKSYLFNLLLSKLDNNLQDGNSWNIKKKLVKMGVDVLQNELFYSTYQIAHPLKLSQFNEISDALLNEQKKIETTFKNTAKACQKVMQDEGVKQSDFNKRNNNAAINNINKVATDPKTIKDKVTDYLSNKFDESYFIDDNKPDNVRNAYEKGILPFIVAAANYLPAFISLSEVNKNIHELGISLATLLQLSKYRAEKEKILLKDISVFLSAIFAQGAQAANFIFEKSGLSINHVLLDEFQDTSRLQWDVFKPLIDNALSTEGGSAFLVGDAKQSIYRWRNGDWRLMEEVIPESYDTINIIKSENWRSSENIIKFNNALYSIFPSAFANFLEEKKSEKRADNSTLTYLRQEAQKASKIYDAHTQKLPKIGSKSIENSKKGKGYVKIVKEATESELFSVENQLNDCHFNQLCEDINACFKRGYQPSDIAILSRNNTTLNELMLYINRVRHFNPGFFSVNFSFETESKIEINTQPLALFFVNMFLAIYHSGNKQYSLAYIANSGTILNQILEENYNAIYNLEKDAFNLIDLVSDCLNKKNESTYQVTAFIYQQIAALKNTKTVKQMATFLDFILQYQQQGTRSISGFLSYWDAEAGNVKIEAGDNANNIKLMSIHKAKGLQFPIVFIASTAYFYEKPELFWTNTGAGIFNGIQTLPMVPLITNTNLFYSEYANQYVSELIDNMIDNINVMYVATTRAVDALYIYLGNVKDSRYFKIPFSKCIQQLAQENLPNFKEDESVLEVGAPFNNIKAGNTEKTNLYEGTFALHTMHKNIFLVDADFSPKSAWHTFVERQRGRLIHQFFERLSAPSFFNKVLMELQAEGWFEPEEKSEIDAKLKEILQYPIMQTIYADNVKRYRERKITTQSEAYRPDIVACDGKTYIIVDFKTGKSLSHHQQQIDKYASLLKKIRNKPVKAELLYVD